MRIPRRRLHLRMPEQLADHRQSLTDGDGGRRERVPQVMDADVLEAGARSDTLPEWLKVREPRARFRSHDHPRIFVDALDLLQHIDRRLTEMHDLGAGL